MTTSQAAGASGEFVGKVLFATGAASGIGLAVATGFARHGGAVGIADIATEAGERAAADLVAEGYSATFVHCDVSDSAAVERAIDNVRGSFGGLDCALNNAGVTGPPVLIEEYSDADFRRVVDVHLFGTFACLRREIAVMKAAGGGSIVNVSSIAGMFGAPRSSAYSAAKHGIIGLTKSAAASSGGANVRVNAICPGLIDTPMTQSMFADVVTRGRSVHPIGRAGEPADVAELVLWLFSEASRFVTGTAIPVDGGYMCTLAKV